MNNRKLLLKERVEVRQLEEGLRGSWHPGVVVGVSNLCRSVEYDELLCEAGNSKLIESIPVTETIEGLHRRRHIASTYRGHIRPLPPSSELDSKQKLQFGVCVDALFEDAWWEGVILDNDENASKRTVYFPDEDDECKFSVSKLRVTNEWDEFTGIWRDRGAWTLVQLAKELEGDVPLACCVKKVWSSLRLNYGFIKMISEWTCGVKTVWRKYFMEVVQEIAFGSSLHNLANRKILAWMVGKKGNKLKDPRLANSHLSNTFVQAESCNDLKAFTSRQKGKERCSPSRRKGRKQSSISKSKHEELSINTSTRKNVGADNSLGKKLVKSGVSLIKTDDNIVRGESDQMPDCCSDVNKELCSLPAQKTESGQLESDIVKETSPTVCENKANQFFVDGSGESRMQFQDNQPACSSSTLHGQVNSHLPAFLPDCSKMLASRHAFFSFIHKKRRSSLTRKRILVKYQQYNSKGTHPSKVVKRIKRGTFLVYKQKPQLTTSKLEAIPKNKGKGLNAKRKGGDLLAGQHRPCLPFHNCEQKVRLKDMVSPSRRRKKKWRGYGSELPDTICSVCHYGGDLITCGHCPCSYHLSCINLKKVPSENWFCPSCCCGLCGLRDIRDDSEHFTNACLQCTRQYHVACLRKIQHPSCADYTFEGFCSEACYKLCSQLHQLLGVSNPTTVDGLGWTLMRSRKTGYNFPDISRAHTWIKLSNVLKVIHECFEPVKEPHTHRDLARDIVFNSVSKLKRLDFRGFYSMVLHNADEILSVATVRILGLKSAELPLVATPFKYRRQGMCRLLLQELEKLLSQMGIERLILPSIPQLRETWETSFGFLEMPLSERLNFLGYPFLAFQGTTMLQKCLSKSVINKEMRGNSLEAGGNTSAAYVKHKQGSDSVDRFSGLSYDRRLKLKVIGKENVANNCGRLTQLSDKFYKRRRLLAS